MRKRRRLANKMTMMVCAVLIAVSAFFYAPMEVSASSANDYAYVVSGSDTSFTAGKHSSYWSGQIDFVNYDLIDDAFYLVRFDYKYEVSSQKQYNLLYAYGSVNWKPILYLAERDGLVYQSTVFGSDYFVMQGKNFENLITISFDNVINCDFDTVFNYVFSFNINSITQLTGEESASYQQGYNVGYSAGEEAGESNGYSSGYSDGYEAGEQSGYDSGFQAGSDSVDTQSYYDAGYSAGYDAGYLEGYETGYDEGYLDGFENGVKDGEITGYEKGYEDALEYYTKGRVSNVPDFSNTFRYYFSGGNSSYDGSNVISTNYDFVKDNEYNITFDISYSYYFSSLNNISGTPTLSTRDWSFNLCGVDFYLDSGFGTYSFDFVPSTLDNNINLSYGLSAMFFPADWTTAFSCACDFTVNVKNVVITSKTGRSMGEILEDIERQDLNTQHIIQDGFNDAMNGYDASVGNTANSDLSTGLNEYETAENSLFTTATTGMKDFVFFDFESVPAMVTGMSFVGSIMGSWFEQAGGASGVGIVLSILFSVMLVAMVLGLYRWYQSRGGKK